MPNVLDSTGLTIKTLPEIIASLTASLQSIYGSDINVDQNSPDGQAINIYAQMVYDTLQMTQSIYNSFSPAAAFGTVLDQRLAINGIARIQGTYTITPVSITVDRALTLTGLDALVATPTATVFTVADAAGNQFYLQTTQSPAIAGTNVYNFRAVNIGKVQTTLNTITNQSTSILGVTAVNNPSVASSVGIDEETDVQLKLRQAKMFQLAATGPADAVRAAILSATGVTDAYVVENATSSPVTYGPSVLPANSIWCIANGGTDAVVASAIYSKKAPGCGLFGASSAVVARSQGNSITINFDRAVAQNLYIQFSIIGKFSGAAWDNASVKTALAAALTYTLNQTATVGDIVSAMETIVPQGYLVSTKVSGNGSTFGDNATPTSPKYYFVTDASRITIS